jgi:hypothetical protein
MIVYYEILLFGWKRMKEGRDIWVLFYWEVVRLFFILFLSTSLFYNLLSGTCHKKIDIKY